MEKKNLPKIQDLYNEVELYEKLDDFRLLMNQDAPSKWIKIHPYIRNYRYIPIDKIEYLLRNIFKQYKIEILTQGISFNGVFVVVRVHYLHPITGEWLFHDGIGASQLQTKKDTSVTDMININNGAISMAYPTAKTIAVKDACDHFGKLFGSDLNRLDVLPTNPSKSINKQDIVDDLVAIVDVSELTESERQAFTELIESGTITQLKAQLFKLQNNK